MSAEQDRRPPIKVLRGGSNDSVQVFIGGIKGDMGEEILSMSIQKDGDVCLTLSDPQKGAVDIEFCTGQGGGKNPELTTAFRDFVRSFADLIESLQKTQP